MTYKYKNQATFIVPICVLLVAITTAMVIGKQKEKSVEWPKTKPIIVQPVAPEKPAEVVTPSKADSFKGLSSRKRRQIGITIVEALSIGKELKQAGEIDDATTAAEWAGLAGSKFVVKNRAKFNEGLDIDQLLSWLEAIWPIIQMLLDLFAEPQAGMEMQVLPAEELTLYDCRCGLTLAA